MQSKISAQHYFEHFIGRYSITKRLSSGFGVILLILATTVLFIDFRLAGIGEAQDNVINLRMPTNVAGHDLVNGINYSLAALRGYIILNDTRFKEQRQEAWQQIDHNINFLTEMSRTWTEVKNKQRLTTLKQILAEFRQAQSQVESISHSAEEQPAMEMLRNEAAPKATKIVAALTMMIDTEKSLAPTQRRKNLLADLSDSRASFALAIAAMRTFLIGGEQVWVDEFKKHWATNTEQLSKIERTRNLLNTKQLAYFTAYHQLRNEFVPLSKEMIKIRQSKQWNQANFLLATEAVPKAASAMRLLDDMIESQNTLIATDAQALQDESTLLQTFASIIAFLAIILGAFIAKFITRIVVEPTTRLTNMLIQVSKEGKFNQRLKVTSKDELGQSTQAFNLLMDSMELAIGEVKEVVSKLARGDTSGRINADLKGDLAQLKNDTNSAIKQVAQNEAERLDLEKQARIKHQEAKVLAQETTRINRALDVCQANVMMVDNELNIIYANGAVIEMMQANETQLKTVLPDFQANDLIGSGVHNIHTNPVEQYDILATITGAYYAELKLAGFTFDQTATPVFDNDGVRIGIVVEWHDTTEALRQLAQERSIANENQRVRQALDTVATSTMIADANHNIIYTNHSINKMFRLAESDIRKDLPHFTASKVQGSNIDEFHLSPTHQHPLLNTLDKPHRIEIIIGGRTFTLMMNAINNEQNERIGTVVEWEDRTMEVAVENEIDHIVSSAVAGDLSQRINLKGKTGFFKKLGTELNQLVNIAEEVILDTARVLDAMAHGKLTEKIDSDYQGLFGQLKQDANSTVDKLTEVLVTILNSSHSVTQGANEIALGNADLAQRTEKQAASLEETASSMDEMTSSLSTSTKNAGQVNQLSNDARAKADLGGEVVSRAVSAMAEINTSSNKIADIIGVIDEIAFQTNLLALNAAVEAARAGEQGRGFAVVAGEVRTLAQRSATAAKEIKDLIRDSIVKVEAGTTLVNDSGKTLNDIVAAVGHVSHKIAEISSASQEQMEGISQVNQAINQLDQMTQQNASLVEEASAAGEAMAEQAQGMTNLVSFFTLDEGMLPPLETPHTLQTAHKTTDIQIQNNQNEWDEF